MPASREILLPPLHGPPDEGLDGRSCGSVTELEETRVAGKAGRTRDTCNLMMRGRPPGRGSPPRF